jgi:hypothetical protein
MNLLDKLHKLRKVDLHLLRLHAGRALNHPEIVIKQDVAHSLTLMGSMDQIQFVHNLHLLVFGMSPWKRAESDDLDCETVAQLMAATDEEKWAALLYTLNSDTELLK